MAKARSVDVYMKTLMQLNNIIATPIYTYFNYLGQFRTQFQEFQQFDLHVHVVHAFSCTCVY